MTSDQSAVSIFGCSVWVWLCGFPWFIVPHTAHDCSTQTGVKARASISNPILWATSLVSDSNCDICFLLLKFVDRDAFLFVLWLEASMKLAFWFWSTSGSYVQLVQVCFCTFFACLLHFRRCFGIYLKVFCIFFCKTHICLAGPNRCWIAFRTFLACLLSWSKWVMHFCPRLLHFTWLYLSLLQLCCHTRACPAGAAHFP